MGIASGLELDFCQNAFDFDQKPQDSVCFTLENTTYGMDFWKNGRDDLAHTSERQILGWTANRPKEDT